MYIYQRVSKCDFHDAFLRMGRSDQFSYQGKNMLFEYFEELSQSVNEPIELDVISMCGEWAEYVSAKEAWEANNEEIEEEMEEEMEEEIEEKCLRDLERRHFILHQKNCVLVQT